MKRSWILIVVLFVVPASMTFSQTEKGQVFLGISSRYSLNPVGVGISLPDMMSLSFSTVKFKSDDDNNDDSGSTKFNCFNLIPKAGYFVIDNLAVGIDLQLGIYSLKETYDSDIYKDQGTVFSAGPFIRYYFPVNKILPYLEAGGSLGSAVLTSEYENEEDKSKTSMNSFSAGAGISAPLGEKVALDLMLGYLSMTMKDKEDNPDNERMVIGTFGFKFGVLVFL
ncbi:MAG: porin family protein [Lentimicrobium sp.]|nr:porin family protein [Lentimicrobium sp.]